jgi:hypothetical protein
MTEQNTTIKLITGEGGGDGGDSSDDDDESDDGDEQYGRSRAILDATGRRHRVIICPVCPGGRHGHQFWRKKSSCGVVKSLFKASVK